jgi:hypothetical protein
MEALPRTGRRGDNLSILTILILAHELEEAA